MEIMRKRALRISMGDYESFETDAFVKVSHQDIGFTDEQWTALSDTRKKSEIDRLHTLLSDTLDGALGDDIADAQALTGNRKSFIHKIPA